MILDKSPIKSSQWFRCPVDGQLVAYIIQLDKGILKPLIQLQVQPIVVPIDPMISFIWVMGAMYSYGLLNPMLKVLVNAYSHPGKDSCPQRGGMV